LEKALCQLTKDGRNSDDVQAGIGAGALIPDLMSKRGCLGKGARGLSADRAWIDDRRHVTKSQHAKGRERTRQPPFSALNLPLSVPIRIPLSPKPAGRAAVRSAITRTRDTDGEAQRYSRDIGAQSCRAIERWYASDQLGSRNLAADYRQRSIQTAAGQALTSLQYFRRSHATTRHPLTFHTA